MIGRSSLSSWRNRLAPVRRDRPFRYTPRTAPLAVMCLLLLLSMGGPALALQGAVDGEPGVGDPYFPNIGNSGYDVQHYDLTLQINSKTHKVNGVASIALTPTADLRSFTFDLVGFNVSAVDVDGIPARIERPERKLRIVPEQVLTSGAPVVVRVTYAGKPTRLGLNGWFWFKDGGALLSTQPAGASMLFPCNDHPIDKATFGFDVATRRGTVAVANGLMQGSPERDGKWMRFRWSEPGAFPTYAAVVAVGKFKMKSSFADGALPVVNAFPKGEKVKKSDYKHERNRKKRNELAGNTVKRLDKRVGPQRDMVSLLERYFGPYPYSSIGAIITTEERPEAMEAATRPTYPGVENALKDQYFKMLVAHEISHMWAGNMVTPETWRDIWLNEGFATYSELLWIAEARDLPLGSLFAFSSCCFGYYKGMERPAGDPGADELFNVTVYNRGAMTLEALRRTIGDEVFFRLMREWMDRYRDQNVNTEDFIQLAEDMSGQQLDDLFQTWLYEWGLPTLPPDPNVARRGIDDGSSGSPELRDDAEFRGHRVNGGEP